MKLKTFIGYGLVAATGYFVGKMGIAYVREKAGRAVSWAKPKAQQALTAGYVQALAIVNEGMQRSGVIGQATPGVVDGKASVIVKYPPGTDTSYASSYLPPVAAGMPVVVK